MTPVIHCSLGNITLVPRIVFSARKEIHLTRCDTPGKDTRLKSSKRFLLPQSSLKLFQLYQHRIYSEIRRVAAVGADIIEETNPTVPAEVADGDSEAAPSSVETSGSAPSNPSTTSSSKTKRPRPGRMSEMPPVKDEELVPGASFIGKVRSIQPFGCFVDIGAYTDGLVHVSRMSNAYVKDVASVVSIGQEVRVRIVEANKETGRISLTMRDQDDTTKVQLKKNSLDESNEKSRSSRKNPSRSNQRMQQKSSKFVKGQILDGTVKNLTRSGAFVTLPDGEEGFLPVSEESESFDAILGNSSLQVGQEVNVRVLRIARGQATLTMKKEDDKELDMRFNQGPVHAATNPFELAFRKNKEISAFLDERERAHETPEKIVEAIGEVAEMLVTSDASDVDSSVQSYANQLISSSDSSVEVGNEKSSVQELPNETLVVDSISNILESKDEDFLSAFSQTTETLGQEDEESSKFSNQFSPESLLEKASAKDDVQYSGVTEGENITSESSFSDGDESSYNNLSPSPVVDEDSLASESKETNDDINASEKIQGALTSEEAEASLADEVKETEVMAGTLAQDELYFETTGSEEKEGLVDSAQDGDYTEKIDIKDSTGLPIENAVSTETVTPEDLPSSQLDNPIATEDEAKDSKLLVENETVPAELPVAKSEAGVSINGQNTPYEDQSSTKSTISPALVKQLREETGAGMMDCKKALAETGGDIVKAQEYLRKKGLASADKKASRATAEGRIGSYIHDSRIGVLIEVNCETDFVSRGEIFKGLVDDLAMQVAACPQVRYLVTEDVPEELVAKEREIEMQKEDLLTKPENIRSKIVDGRIKKRLEEFALLEQPYIKNDKMIVKDFVKQTIATLGENIKVKRYVRYNLGEGLEKKSQDFAAEVAAQTTAKSSPAVPKDQPTETKESAEKPKTVAVSAALVKQLREETGAGMMDCKKALAETGGDLEKAQEYLRKKGLSSADKKSSRLAAEGRISSYIHDSRIGTLIEVNCETDFVGRNEKFKELVDDLAMQIVACPQVEFVSIEEIPESIVMKEKEIEMQRDDLKMKPDNIKEKIVEGRITKRLGELALLEQPFIKDDSIKVKDLVKQTVAALGENIKVRRFVRFTLGES